MIAMKLVRRAGGEGEEEEEEEESEQACDVLRPALTKYLAEASKKMRKMMGTYTKVWDYERSCLTDDDDVHSDDTNGDVCDHSCTVLSFTC